MRDQLFHLLTGDPLELAEPRSGVLKSVHHLLRSVGGTVELDSHLLINY